MRHCKIIITFDVHGTSKLYCLYLFLPPSLAASTQVHTARYIEELPRPRAPGCVHVLVPVAVQASLPSTPDKTEIALQAFIFSSLVMQTSMRHSVAPIRLTTASVSVPEE